jgi:hypothetical protein
MERHARAAVMKLIDDDGALLVSDATPINKMYATRPTGVFPRARPTLMLTNYENH